MVCDGGRRSTVAQVGKIRKDNESDLGRFDSIKGIVSNSFIWLAWPYRSQAR